MVREFWGASALESLWKDAQYALRGMRRNPRVSAVAVASLALGIGANTAIFSLVNTILLRMLPVADPGRLVELLFKAPQQDHFNAFSLASYQHYRASNHVFSGVIAFAFEPFSLRGPGLDAELVRGLWVSANYFSVLGVNPGLGRLIGPGDNGTSDRESVAVLSWPYWNSRFHGDPAIIGKRIAINGVSATVIGVTPRGFMGLEPASRWDVWLPLAMEPLVNHPSESSSGYWLKLAARLKPGVSIEQARAEMPVLFRWSQDDEFRRSNDRSVYRWHAEVQPAGSGLSLVRDQFGRPAVVLMGVVTVLLLIACANVAGLLLAHGASRRREMAVRVALGAGRGRLVRQGLAESLLLAMTGGSAGVVLAYWGAAALARIVASGRLGIELDVRPDRVVLLFTIGVALLSGILFGLAPAWQAAGSFRASPLREMWKAGETPRRRFFSRGLVTLQVALSVVLLSAASLFVSYLVRLERLDLGFRRDHLLLVSLDASNSGYSRERQSLAYRDLLGRLEATPGVRSASICAFYPESGVGAMRPANVEGYQAKPGERRYLSESWVAPKYFATLGMPLLMGRDFSFEDQGRPRVAIVNQTLVRYFFGGANPIGKHIMFDNDEQPYEIIGMVGDTRSTDPQMPAMRFVYFNMFQTGHPYSEFMLRTLVDPGAVAPVVRRTVRATLKTVSVRAIRTMTEHVDAAIVPERLIATLSGLFGALGSGLAALGLYGLLAFTVARRTGEIGIRIALGADRAHVIRIVIGDAAAMVCVGLLIGVPIAQWGRRFAISVIPGLTAGVALPLAVGASLMIALAIAAAYIPARRALRVDPMEALRYE
jgi:predicted permease